MSGAETTADDSARSARPPAGPVLAEGHLHPGMLFVRFLDGLRQSLLPVAVAVIVGQLWLAVASGVFLVFGLLMAVVRFVSFRYRLTPDELVTTEGILQRQERRIPVDRIQDLGFESSLLRRLLGLVVVSVETASGQGSEARLDSLGEREARALRETLHRLRGGPTDAERAATPALVLHRASLGDLVLLGLTDNRLGAILLGLLGAIEVADRFGLAGSLDAVLGPTVESASHLGPALLALLGFAFVFVALVAGWVLAIGGNILLYHGFALTEREGVLQRRFGLLTTRVQSLPRHKIQRVSIEASPLRRLFDVVVVRADSAGSGQQPGGGDRGGSRDVVLPLASRPRALVLIGYMLGVQHLDRIAWRPVSVKVILRTTVKATLFGGVLAAVLWGAAGVSSLLALLLGVLGFGAGIAAWRNMGYAQLDDHTAFRWGILGRYQALVPYHKVQAVLVRANPFERVAGLAHLTVLVAGGSPTTLGSLPVGEARRLRDAIAARAARSRFVW